MMSKDPSKEPSPHGPPSSTSATAAPDVAERGAPRDGIPQTMNRRLFMQLLGFETPAGTATSTLIHALGNALAKRDVSSVIYEDVSHPSGFALLSWSENPEDFVAKVRPTIEDQRASMLRLRPELTMLGRTYSSGYETDLEYWLLRRPRETVLNEAWPWAVWYPLRRDGAFERLDSREKGGIMREHGEIGKAYGAADFAHDIRLACHGLDPNDNDFVIGLVGKDLHPLSHVVQSMRRTRQTSEFIVRMGPFFVGRAVFRNAGK
jgi:chlorite dismutase